MGGDGSTGTNLSSKYPGDVGIDKDPSVVFAERFSEGSIASVAANYDTATNTSYMTLSTTDLPAGLGGVGSGSMAMPGTSSMPGMGSDLYKDLAKTSPNKNGYDALYVRWYMKFVGSDANQWDHSAFTIGGYDPPLPYPYPRAGTLPKGNDWVYFYWEPNQNDTPNPAYELDWYNVWMNMHNDTPAAASPTCTTCWYGNTLAHDPSLGMDYNQWDCYEFYIALNTDLTSATGSALTVWKNDALVQSLDSNGPSGYWYIDDYCPASAIAADPFCKQHASQGQQESSPGLQFRTTASLQLNHIWMQSYNQYTTNNVLEFANVVAATQRIGCASPAQ
jgi:hypothetical protein